MVNEAIKALAQYGANAGLIQEEDRVCAINRILEVMQLDTYEDVEISFLEKAELQDILAVLIDDAQSRGLLQSESIAGRDLFDTKLMGALTPMPREIIHAFFEQYQNKPSDATDYYYKLSQDTHYIRRDRMKKDMRWISKTDYGAFDITINLAKPEKDPRDIAKAGTQQATGYPKCLLCKENEGYVGRMNHPARQNHRIIPLTLGGEAWFLQYSPYVYYNEHCIVLNSQHVPMKINRRTFEKLLDFVEQFPHYFIGSNADLPIVGGSILSHDHFQGGHHEFAMAKAPVEYRFQIKGFENVQAGSVQWPMYTIRLNGKNKGDVVKAAEYMLEAWRAYTDEEAFIYAYTDGVAHNTITPIARMVEGQYQLDLVLRNNITTDEHPMGLYHPHAELHNIKKENIGLIEVMGLAVLPARLKDELEWLAHAILEKQDIAKNEKIAHHAQWAAKRFSDQVSLTYEEMHERLKQEVGKTFQAVLEDAGVFKRTPQGEEAAKRFIRSLG